MNRESPLGDNGVFDYRGVTCTITNSTITEDRLIAIGYSLLDRILTVVHCYKEDDEVIRIISARKATKQEKNSLKENNMKKSYDLSKMKEVKPSYLKKLKQQVTIKLDTQVIEYFKALSETAEIPSQTLINLYLKECAETKKKLKLKWEKTA